MQRHAYELVVVVQAFANGPLDQEATSSTTAEWSSSTIQSAAVLLSVHVTQCPVSFKGPRSSCQLVFHQWNVSPILCCSSREGMVHLRRGLRPLEPASCAHAASTHQCSTYSSFRMLADTSFASCASSSHETAGSRGRIRRPGAICTPEDASISHNITT